MNIAIEKLDCIKLLTDSDISECAIEEAIRILKQHNDSPQVVLIGEDDYRDIYENDRDFLNEMAIKFTVLPILPQYAWAVLGKNKCIYSNGA